MNHSRKYNNITNSYSVSRYVTDNPEDRSFELLIKNIVLQAIKDYIWAQNHLHSSKKETRIKARRLIIELDNWFVSEDFKLFTNLSGSAILKLLKEKKLFISNNFLM